jgi:site-specific DNA recombinase
LEYLEGVGFDVLIVHAIDRLARDSYIRQTLEIEFEKHSAKVEYVLGDYDDTPEGEVRKDLDATFAKWENAKRVERCNRGKKRKAETGLFVCGRPPYGYRVDKTAFGGLAVVEEQAAVVREVFRMYAEEGMSIRGIVRALTKRKVSPALGGEKWAMSSINRMLRNSTYVGRCSYNKHRKNGNRLEKRSRDEWIHFKTTPIIEQWQYDEAQRRLADNRKVRRRQPSRFYLLSGMVLCAQCERPYFSMTQRAGKQRRKNDAQSYRHRKKHVHCSNHQISARVLEPLVWDEITKVLMDPDRLRKGYEGSLAQQAETAASHRVHLEVLCRRVGSLEHMRRNLTTAYVDPDITMTKAEYVEQKESVDSELKGLQTEIERVEKELASIPTPADLETLEAFASAVRETITSEVTLSPEDRRKILQMLHIKIFIDKRAKEFRIEGWFGPPIGGLSYTISNNYGPQPPLPPAPA